MKRSSSFFLCMNETQGYAITDKLLGIKGFIQLLFVFPGIIIQIPKITVEL